MTDGAPPEAAPGPSGPRWPSAAGLVGRGLDLAARTTPQLRPVSLVLGFEVLGLVGPLVVLLIAVGTRLGSGVLAPLIDPSVVVPPEDASLASTVSLSLLIAVPGLAAVVLEGRLIATALIAGRLVGRPLELPEALRRSRQTFWRVVRATLLAQIPVTVIGSWAGDELDAALGLGAAASGIGSALVTTVLGAPFAYVTTSIVLGDVPALEALRRSVRLARSRWRLALVVAFFAAFAQVILAFGLAAGLDVLARVSGVLGLGLDGGAAVTFVTLVVALFAVVAFGTLLFSVMAIVAAPEVVAFVGLTGYAAGLDRARNAAAIAEVAAAIARATGWRGGAPGSAPSDPPVAPPRVRWLSAPMAIAIVLSVALSLSGLSNILERG